MQDLTAVKTTYEIVRVWRGPSGWQVASKVLVRVWASDPDDALAVFAAARAAVGMLAPYPGELGARAVAP